MNPVLLLVMLTGSLFLGGCKAEQDNMPLPAATEASEFVLIPEPYVVPAPPAIPQTVEEIFPDVGRRWLVLNNCATCHAVACLALGQRTPAQWAAVEATHTNAIPGMSKEDLGKAFDYLKRHFNNNTPEPVTRPEWLNGECTAGASGSPLPSGPGN
ncbi:MAG: hypothetical protein LBG44_11955 [Gemmatimonadota bacterium]|jgi:hypothetical protein|nr:hypothetical protein [Gemmatimonadota bacterium]